MQLLAKFKKRSVHAVQSHLKLCGIWQVRFLVSSSNIVTKQTVERNNKNHYLAWS